MRKEGTSIMHYSVIKPYDIANGPGVRVSLFCSGCNIHCPGCFNEEAWSFDFGQPFTDDTMRTILDDLDHPWIEGFTMLGGEPMDNANIETTSRIIETIRNTYPTLNIWSYTGYTLNTINHLIDHTTDYASSAQRLLSNIDVLVEGPFIQAKKDPDLMFRGSSNQHVIDMPQTLKQHKMVLSNWHDIRHGQVR